MVRTTAPQARLSTPIDLLIRCSFCSRFLQQAEISVKQQKSSRSSQRLPVAPARRWITHYRTETLLLVFGAVFARNFFSWIYRGRYTMRRRRSNFFYGWKRGSVWIICLRLHFIDAIRLYIRKAIILMVYWCFFCDLFIFVCFFIVIFPFQHSASDERTSNKCTLSSVRACIINFDSTLGHPESLGQFDGWWARDGGCVKWPWHPQFVGCFQYWCERSNHTRLSARL